MSFPGESDINGFDVENDYLRRLFRIMILPVDDLCHNKYKFDTPNPLTAQTIIVAKPTKKTCSKRTKSCLGALVSR